MKNYLLITLGHGSSAIFVDNSKSEPKVIGYEQERFSRIKADSQFPIDAINEILHNVRPAAIKGCRILISHWFNFVENCIPNKYFTENDFAWLTEISTDINYASPKFTHHDAHAYSAYTFYKYCCEPTHINHTPVHCIVADGFGNNEEVFSIYSLDMSNPSNKPVLVHRAFGYYISLGLFYQYATSFVGMKENQDEYKFLGYESHIDEGIFKVDIEALNVHIESCAETFVSHILNDTVAPHFGEEDEYIDVDELQAVRQYWHSQFKDILTSLKINDFTSFKSRCIIAYFIQQTIEKVLTRIAYEFSMTNLCVAGGCFYNVKLNNALLNAVPGLFSVVPLAGDQGAAIGMYAAEVGIGQFPFDTLAWGKRRLYNFAKLAANRPNVNYVHLHSDSDCLCAAHKIANLIADGNIVDLVFNNMEFGPRALCNTSTLFLPTTMNAEHNNHMNHRNEVMPCAPVCTHDNAVKLFGEDISRVVGSDRFMICTHNYKRSYSKQYGGVMHKKTLYPGIYTGRPQIVSKGSFSDMILREVERLTDTKCLVNTSFNVHGNPIVFDTADILQNHAFQMSHAEPGYEPILFVIES